LGLICVARGAGRFTIAGSAKGCSGSPDTDRLAGPTDRLTSPKARRTQRQIEKHRGRELAGGLHNPESV